jgi:hypothetical protein
VIDPPAHIVVRLPVKGERLEEIIDRHNAVVRVSGAVLFGIRGQAPSSNRIESLSTQISDRTTTFLYVVQLQAPTIRVFRAEIISLAESLPVSESARVPPYYVEFQPDKPVVCWMKVGVFGEIPQRVLKDIKIQFTGSPLIHVLMKSRGSVLIVS